MDKKNSKSYFGAASKGHNATMKRSVRKGHLEKDLMR